MSLDQYPGLHGEPLLEQIEKDYMIWDASVAQAATRDRLVRLRWFSSTGERLLFHDDTFRMPGCYGWRDDLIKELANRILAHGLIVCTMDETGSYRGFPLARRVSASPVQGATLVTSIHADIRFCRHSM